MRVLALLLLLAACAPQPSSPLAKLGTFTESDLEAAITLANATGDANGAACWSFLATLIPTLPTAEPVGAATAVEIARLGQMPMFAAKCGPLGILTGQPTPF